MIRRVVLAVVVGVAVTLACYLLGALLTALHVELATVVGGFLTRWGGVLGFLAALWWFFMGHARYAP